MDGGIDTGASALAPTLLAKVLTAAAKVLDAPSSLLTDSSYDPMLRPRLASDTWFFKSFNESTLILAALTASASLMAADDSDRTTPPLNSRAAFLFLVLLIPSMNALPKVEP